MTPDIDGGEKALLARARAILVRLGCCGNDGRNEPFPDDVAYVEAALAQSAADERERTIRMCMKIAQDADMNGLIDRIDRHRGHRIAHAIANAIAALAEPKASP